MAWVMRLLPSLLPSLALAQLSSDESLHPCGEVSYYPSKYTCYDTDYLCPVLGGKPTLRCDPDCYLPEMYSCSDGHLVYPPTLSSPGNPSSFSSMPMATCTADAKTIQLNSPLYDNSFYSDCHASSQVVVTSSIPESNLAVIGPRIIVAWPAGNSGIVAYFEPQNGIDGTLGIQVVNSTIGSPLSPVYDDRDGENATLGISAQVEFNSTAVLSVAILGSIRTCHDHRP
ncbi:hypothetical protein IFR05_013213 [Cadophora sp. M221]|nr:hypothetical protein IFR05_013213 [Cadophora sp. M221]